MKHSDPRLARAIILALTATLSACAGGAGTGGGGAAPDAGAWAEWEAPRPQALDGAPRVTVSDILLLGGDFAPGPDGASPSVGLQELVSLGLIRRQDVQFVERRRFGPAAERERRGQPQPSGSPPVGTSPGAELILSGTWAGAGADSAYLDLRLADATSGQVVTSWRMATPSSAELPELARLAVGGLLEALDDMDRRPAWSDPLTSDGVTVAPPSYSSLSIPPEAASAFLRGLAAEDRFEWDVARSAYEEALDQSDGDFFEVEAALARAARLRAGGTLGQS